MNKPRSMWTRRSCRGATGLQFFRRQWFRARRWFSFAGADVARALLLVIGGGERVRRGAGLTFSEITLEKRHTPAAPGARTAAIAQLACDARFVDANVIEDLPLRNVEAVTDRVVKFQDILTVLCGRRRT